MTEPESEQHERGRHERDRQRSERSGHPSREEAWLQPRDPGIEAEQNGQKQEDEDWQTPIGATLRALAAGDDSSRAVWTCAQAGVTADNHASTVANWIARTFPLV